VKVLQSQVLHWNLGQRKLVEESILPCIELSGHGCFYPIRIIQSLYQHQNWIWRRILDQSPRQNETPTPSVTNQCINSIKTPKGDKQKWEGSNVIIQDLLLLSFTFLWICTKRGYNPIDDDNISNLRDAYTHV